MKLGELLKTIGEEGEWVNHHNRTLKSSVSQI